MIPDQAWQLVPDNLPVEIEPWVTNFAARAEFTPRETAAYVWATHLLRQLNGQVISTAVLGLLIPSGEPTEYEIIDISAGFIPYSKSGGSGSTTPRELRLAYPVPSVAADDYNYSFGVVIGLRLLVAKTKEEPRVTPDLSQLVALSGGFPVVAEYRQVLESAPPHPTGVTSACYAKPRSSKRFAGPLWNGGILIARHVLGNLGFSPGTLVPMRSGALLTVADIDAATTIDAAILDCGTVPTGSAPLALAPAVSVGTTVQIRTVGGGFSAQVLRIYEHQSYYGNMMSHRLFTDAVGVPGDSGSLVTRASHLDAAGLYMGSTQGSPPEGIVQSMRQVVQYFDLDLFD